MSFIRLFRSYRSARERTRFCERSFLDPEIMAEIRNVKDQLGEIVSELGVPLLGGGSPDDYLCAMASGLIQFVCVRDGRNQYRNLTTDRIQIHPGSVLFRTTPRFIVAGEIVRTTRMWARSVSPLEQELVKRVNPELLRQLQAAEKGRAPRTMQTENEVLIHGRAFPVRRLKGAKNLVELPWNDLKTLLRKGAGKLPPEIANRKAVVLYQDQEIFSREKIGVILAHARFIDPESDIVSSWPGRKQFSSAGLDALASQIHLVMKLTRTKKSARSLGFITLNTNSNGQYWFTVQRHYFSAVGESLAALEVLLDELPENSSPGSISTINETYRRLLSMYET